MNRHNSIPAALPRRLSACVAGHPYAALAALLAAALLLTAGPLQVQVAVPGTAAPSLPEQVGAWQGIDVGFCHRHDCRARIEGHFGAILPPCPRCGEPLHGMSLIEKEALPPDTSIRKKRYRSANGERVTAAIVVSGAERQSIHRPQRCLVSQGIEIVASRVVSLPPSGDGRPLKVMWLRCLARAPGGGPAVESCYVYWFASRDRRTPYHAARLFWVAWDRLTRRAAYPWAYVSETGPSPGDAAQRASWESFVRALHDAMNGGVGSTTAP